ncbi:cobalamin-dependent protein, partial [Myxococcota bacterium]|nr:cobalamin-dependent protein [Myxococcota bacterium]
MLDFVPKSDTPKILFISPPYHAGVVEVAGRWLPLPFVYLAAVAREKGWDVQIYDAMSAFVSHQDILNRIEEWQPDIVATSAITATFPDAMEMMAGAKRLGALTLIGGVHPSFMWKETLDFEGSPVDIVAIGEAEDTLADILDVLVNKGDLATVAGVAYLKDGVAARTAIR